MDPSCTLGFYCCNLADYEEFVEILTEVRSVFCITGSFANISLWCFLKWIVVILLLPIRA